MKCKKETRGGARQGSGAKPKYKEQLLNRRPYVLGAISAWKENRYNATPDRVAYNVNYFEVELRILDNELARL